jgi:hypothetical protein
MAQVKVPQADGDIVINDAGEITTYEIKDSKTEVEDSKVTHFLRHVEGSSLVADTAKDGRPSKTEG